MRGVVSPFHHAAWIITMVCTLGCGGGGTPTQPPSPPPAAPSATAGTLRGSVIDTTSGAPVEGATITFTAGTNQAITTGSSGGWEFSLPGSTLAAIPIEVTAPGYVTRRTHLRWAAGTRTDVAIDIIREQAPFSMAYYRQIVRDLFDKPNDPPQPLRRWTQQPNFYVNTLNPKTGSPILPSELDLLVASIRASVPQMTGGRYQAGEIIAEAADRPQQHGFINVRFVNEPDVDNCGTAFIGANPGLITINSGRPACGTPCGAFAPRIVAHEVGHAMGFFHVAEGSILNLVWYASDCANTAFSAAEQHHARVAYARPPFNRDPDDDPSTATLVQTGALPPLEVRCR